MYAVIETGGKQYRVEVGTELEVELLDAEVGTEISLDRVLLVADGDKAAIGRPTVENATVRAEVVRRDRGEKVISFKYRPKARRRVKKGHRQDHLVLRIADITLDGKSAAAVATAKSDAKKAERAKVEEAAARQAAEDAALAAKLAEKAKAAEAAAAASAEAAAAPAEAEAPAKKTRAEKKTAVEGAAGAETDAPAPKRTRTKKDA